MLIRIACGLILALGCAGCVVVVKDKGDGGGPPPADDGGPPPDDGMVVDEPAPEPAPVDDRPGGPTGPARRRFVGGYRDDYRHLPKIGNMRKYMAATWNRVDVDRGYYEGEWKCSGKGFYKKGAGQGETVIDGHLIIKGDNWTITNCTITGNVTITGSNNDISKCQVFGRIDVEAGVNNKTP